MVRAQQLYTDIPVPVVEMAGTGGGVGDIEDCVVPSCVPHEASVHGLADAEVTFIRRSLLTWYDVHRRRLPWRGDKAPWHVEPANAGATASVAKRRSVRKSADLSRVSPYATWVSEVMCQQTRVATVIDYHQRWMKRFPTLQALAAARVEDVTEMWAGLGYYRRARLLHKGAQFVVDKHGGQLPRTAKELVKVPGIGPYTAGAIASIQFRQVTPVVDGNVIRVLSRHRAIAAAANYAPMKKLCWSLAGSLVDPQRPGDFNQAVMELGATVCTPKSPLCVQCPIARTCFARKEATTGTSQVVGFASVTAPCVHCDASQWTGRPKASVTEYPLPKKKKAPAERVVIVNVVLGCSTTSEVSSGPDSILLLQRKPTGLLAAQWEFVVQDLGPVASTTVPSASCREELLNSTLLDRTGIQLVPVTSSGDSMCTIVPRARHTASPVVHVFSHVIHNIHVDVTVLDGIPAVVVPSGCPDARWVGLKELSTVGLTTWACKVLRAAIDATPRLRQPPRAELRFVMKRTRVVRAPGKGKGKGKGQRQRSQLAGSGSKKLTELWKRRKEAATSAAIVLPPSTSGTGDSKDQAGTDADASAGAGAGVDAGASTGAATGTGVGGDDSVVVADVVSLVDSSDEEPAATAVHSSPFLAARKRSAKRQRTER